MKNLNNLVKLPYFDYLLALLQNGNSKIEQSFGRHVHWGYWNNPQQAKRDGKDFAEAAENLSRELCQAAHLSNRLSVLDTGCGFGGTIAHINEHYSGMQLTGLNLDERQLQRARILNSPLSGNRIEFVQSNACHLPFPDQVFDVVLAVECIFHFPSRTQFFLEANRVLKPGGILALSDFIPGQIITPFTKISLPERMSRGFYGKCNVQFTQQDYRRLADETRFDMLVERDITVNTLPTYSYLRRLSFELPFYNGYALIETAALELLSRLKLIKYFIYAFQKTA